MRTVYFAMEAITALTILILLYANIYENKQKSQKRKAFSQLLFVNLALVAADAITWLDLNWQDMYILFWVLITITFVLPSLMLAIFAYCLHEHISDKAEISKTPFLAVGYTAIAEGIISLVLCICGKFFEIRNGTFYPGEWINIYYLLYILCLLYFAGVIIAHRKKLVTHDLIASLAFTVFPLISILLSMTDLGINLAVPFVGVNMLLIYVMLQAENESNLLVQTNCDELTGLFNRRAYEDDMMQYPDVPPELDFVYASIDVNGLKLVNDTLGHVAGDELLCGAAYCLKRSLGNYGRVYRTGGDEFVSMFFADEAHLKFVIDDLKNLCEEWKGNLVKSVSMSIGYVTKKEFMTETVAEMAKIADKRMYEDKALYYATKGVDRRGQNEAHKLLCSLYTKILKINITDNTFSIVNMDPKEQTSEMGYAQTISAWLEGFGRSGYVHPADLEEYLAKTNIEYMRSYFKRRKTSLTVLYRRKYDNSFKQVVMEIIPTKDYRDDNQTLFLYVKNIDL